MASTSGLGSAAVPGSAPANSVSRSEATQLVRQVSKLLNRQLSSICQVNGVKSTGIKAELQNRITTLIEDAVRANDPLRFQQIRQSVQNAISNAPAASASPVRASYASPHSLVHGNSRPSPHLQQPMSFNGFSMDGHAARTPHRPMPASRPHINWQVSPFYQIEAPISEVQVCEAMSQHRNSVTVPLKLSDHPDLQKCVNDKSYRVMVFCAGDNSPAVQNIAFPHQSELRVNTGEVKANLRGLKNKPGSTRPVDITDALRLKLNYTNNLEFTYALTNKKFYLVVNLCKITTVEHLVARIADGKKLPIDKVLQEFTEKVQDADVVATSQVLSLKCPLSYMRLNMPCRGIQCSHNQCFDATSYLQLQEQGPQWLCPICNKLTPYNQLVVDLYVQDILDNTSCGTETVTIEPDGHWFVKSNDDERDKHGESRGQHSQYDDDDDDDELEISEVSIVGRRLETPKNLMSSTGTPMSASREPPSAGPRNSAKRPAPAVIDLTLSSDDEDEPIQRAPKRQNTGLNGFHSPSALDYSNGTHGYQS